MLPAASQALSLVQVTPHETQQILTAANRLNGIVKLHFDTTHAMWQNQTSLDN